MLPRNRPEIFPGRHPGHPKSSQNRFRDLSGFQGTPQSLQPGHPGVPRRRKWWPKGLPGSLPGIPRELPDSPGTVPKLKKTRADIIFHPKRSTLPFPIAVRSIFRQFPSILDRFSEVRALPLVIFFVTFAKNGKVAFVWPWPHETRVGTFKKRPTIDEKAIEKRKGNFFGVRTLPARVFFAKVGPGAPEIDPKSTKLCPKVAPGGPRAPGNGHRATGIGQRTTCNGHRARRSWPVARGSCQGSGKVPRARVPYIKADIYIYL